MWTATSIYLAREPHDNDDWEEMKFYCEIKIFYDTPEFVYNPDTDKVEWCNARKIGEAPSYMYPDLKPDKYVEFCTCSTIFNENEYEQFN